MKFLPILTGFNQLYHCCSDDLYYYNDQPFSGVILTYFKDNVKQSQTTCTEGRIQGRYQAWYINSNLKVTGNYQDHQETGLWTFYHDNNAIARTGYYHCGSRVGYWKTWDKQGRTLWSGEFHSNDLVNTFYYQRKQFLN